MHVVEPWSHWPCVKFLLLELFVTIFDPGIPSSPEHGYLLLYPWFFLHPGHWDLSLLRFLNIGHNPKYKVFFSHWIRRVVLTTSFSRTRLNFLTHPHCNLRPLESHWMNTTTNQTQALPCWIFIYLLKWGSAFWNFNFPRISTVEK